MAGYDDLPDAWKKTLQPHSELQPQAAPATPATPAATPAASAGPPSDTPSWWQSIGNVADAVLPGRDTSTAIAGGMYNVGSAIMRNLGGTPNQLPPDAQAAMQAHPTATTVGNVIGGTAVALPLAAGAEFAAPFVGLGGTGLGTSVVTGAATGAAQNALAGNPDESLTRRAVTGAGLGAAFGAAGNRIGSWFGAGKSIPSEVADAAKIAQQEGVTDIRPGNLPGRGDIKATGAPPTYEQAGQIDNSVSKILDQDVRDFKPANLNTVKNNIGSNITTAARSGQINAQPGGAFDQALTQVQQFARANGVGNQIDPMVNQVRARIQNGVISGQDFDNLVGAGSPLHNLVGDDNPFVKQSAQALDKVMDSGFQASSPPGAYDDWVDARTKYRMLMGVEKSLLPNGHVNPTTLFNSIQNRFTDIKGVPVTNDPLVGRLGQFASSIKTLFGGGASPPQGASPGFWKQAAAELGIGGAPAIVSGLASGNLANPENYLSPAGLAGIAAGVGTVGGQLAGRAYQQTQPFVNALINAGGRPIANPLSQYLPAVGTQAFPQRQTQ